MSPAAMLKLSLRALQAAGRRGVILGGWARLEELAKLLANGECLDGWEVAETAELAAFAAHSCCFVSSAPHGWLFPSCSCAVHHGGSGTTHAALLAGLPAVVTPVFGDQFSFAQMITKHGAGIGLEVSLPEVGPEALAEAILSAEQMAETAKTLGERLQLEPGVRSAATVLDAFLRTEVASKAWHHRLEQVRRDKEEERARLKDRMARAKEEDVAKLERARVAEAGAVDSPVAKQRCFGEPSKDDSGDEIAGSAVAGGHAASPTGLGLETDSGEDCKADITGVVVGSSASGAHASHVSLLASGLLAVDSGDEAGGADASVVIGGTAHHAGASSSKVSLLASGLLSVDSGDEDACVDDSVVIGGSGSAASPASKVSLLATGLLKVDTDDEAEQDDDRVVISDSGSGAVAPSHISLREHVASSAGNGLHSDWDSDGVWSHQFPVQNGRDEGTQPAHQPESQASHPAEELNSGEQSLSGRMMSSFFHKIGVGPAS
eukprot:gnl/TRDRNA2_/TRDRNA2_158206_c0_seq1.p1 gnl/TRDRNA2_/TRDRNA2_158206_c0~~gnl/TRDRNA2_/TRDRNA2_158206_c0_seq1.p1  ORF type:complete len:573 (-),score=108.91 gnl/TRDRNA2_/TRDRNA2_158206_c0_seq1:21-1496(-)